MAFNTGDITEIGGTHPTFGKLTFKAKKGTEFTINYGGVKTTDDDEGVTGDGEAMYEMTNSRWSVEGTVAWDMEDRQELKSLGNLSASLA